MRQQRKSEHITLALNTEAGPGKNGFDDIHFINNSLPELDIQDIDLNTHFLNKWLSCPIIINAITGGTNQAENINRYLALLADKYGLAMAVGSQTIAIEEPSLRDTFSVVREMNPEGIILANVAASTSVKDVKEAISMIDADGLQLHLNVAQELAMREGERNFRGVLDNIKRIVDASPVPVIVKEVGFGLSAETARQLYATGVSILDIAGKGGTNFLAIEGQREGMFSESLYNWGIPTAVSLAEITSLKLPVKIIASGGINSALEAAKAISMGADLIAMAGWFLKILLNYGYESLEEETANFIYQLKAIFLLCGASNCEEISKKPLIILNDTAMWLKRRNIDPQLWARMEN